MEFISLLMFVLSTRNLENTDAFYNYNIITVSYTKHTVICMFVIKYRNL